MTAAQPLTILNLGCGNETYGTHRVDMVKTETTTHVFNIEQGIQFSDNFFDIVYSRCFLEHLRNVGFHLQECKRVLKDNGIVDITTDNAECFRYYWFGTHTGRYEKLHPGDRHFSIFTKSHLQNHFEIVGFKDINIEYIKTDTIGKYIDIFTGIKPRIHVKAKK